MRTPERRQNRPVSSRRGATHPRRPASTRTAGSIVTAATNATATETASAGPIVANSPYRVKIMPRNVTTTVPAEAAVTLPTETSAFTTA